MHDRFRSADPLADITEEELLELQKPVPQAPTTRLNPWWERFQYDLYDWDDPEFKKKNVGPLAYVPVRLTQGYFMMVSLSRLEEMSYFPDGREMSWFVDIRYKDGEITSVYAKRRGRVGYDSLGGVLAHRQLLGIVDCPPSIVGDHLNGRGLDNRSLKGKRPINLIVAGRDINNHNTTRFNMHGLPTGVVRIGKEGNYRYYGKVCIRHSSTKVVTIRSKMRWKAPERAGEWYQNYLKRMHGRVMWASKPDSVYQPFFPRLKPEHRYKFGPTLVEGAPTLELEATF